MMANTAMLRITYLQTIRASCDALIALEMQEAEVIQPQNGCPHPDDARTDKTTIDGRRQFWCSVCREMVQGVA